MGKRSYWDVVNSVIERADVLLLMLDARFIEETRNKEVEQKVRKARKPLVYVITKSDLADRRLLEKEKNRLRPAVFVSARDHHGSTILRERILIEAKRAWGKDTALVGVLGYPNVGKSSLINLMKGKHSASVSSQSGHTKGEMLIRADSRILFIDTPGVIPFKEDDPVKHTLIGTVDFTKSKDPDIAAGELMRRVPGKVEAYYGVEPREDKEKTLEAMALAKGLLIMGGLPDVIRMARMVIKDFQEGRIRI